MKAEVSLKCSLNPVEFSPPIQALVSEIVSFLQVSGHKSFSHMRCFFMRATCPVHFSLHEVRSKHYLMKKYKLQTPSLFILFRHSAVSSLVDQNILLSISS
jgi:hypothetical protein